MCSESWVVSRSALGSPTGIVSDVPDAGFNGLYQLHRTVHIFWKKNIGLVVVYILLLPMAVLGRGP